MLTKKPDQSKMQYFFSLALVYLAIVVAVYLNQRNLLYFPDKNINSPEHYGMINTEEIFLNALDGTKLQTWYMKAKDGMPFIVYFHGNGGNLAYRADRYERLNESGYGILALSYRGYGKSEGSPSEEGFYQDARAAINFIKDTHENKKIILFGESLGTGIASKMAKEFEVSALILEAPYTSVQDRAQEIYFWLPARYLVKDKFNNIDNIKNITEPVLIMHGGSDTVIPQEHGKKLFAAANEPKESLFTSDDHSIIFDTSVLRKIENFLRLNGVL